MFYTVCKHLQGLEEKLIYCYYDYNHNDTITLQQSIKKKTRMRQSLGL